jgi:hypothetical protein
VGAADTGAVFAMTPWDEYRVKAAEIYAKAMCETELAKSSLESLARIYASPSRPNKTAASIWLTRRSFATTTIPPTSVDVGARCNVLGGLNEIGARQTAFVAFKNVSRVGWVFQIGLYYFDAHDCATLRAA